jgi:predicted XRE-type DNA-binding protein
MSDHNTKRKEEIIPSSGNVFADLGLPNPEERQTKLRLAVSINRILDRRGWSQAEAARRLDLNQPKISALRNFKLQGFSVERLMRLLTALDQDIQIVIQQKPRSRRTGQVVVVIAA